MFSGLPSTFKSAVVCIACIYCCSRLHGQDVHILRDPPLQAQRSVPAGHELALHGSHEAPGQPVALLLVSLPAKRIQQLDDECHARYGRYDVMKFVVNVLTRSGSC